MLKKLIFEKFQGGGLIEQGRLIETIQKDSMSGSQETCVTVTGSLLHDPLFNHSH